MSHHPSLTDLIKVLKRHQTLQKPIERAFWDIDRAHFMIPQHRDDAYRDECFPISSHETISQPSVVAFMLDLLLLEQGARVLDVGAGSGFTTALIAHIVGSSGSVLGVERNASLVDFARANLAHYPLFNIRIEQSKQKLGWPDNGPYDRILVSAAAASLPEALVQQLAPEGVLVLPIQDSIWQIRDQGNGAYLKLQFPGFRFIPLL